MNSLLVDTTGLSEAHVEALIRFIDKFKQGAVEHGDLPTNKEWTKEALSELCDYGFYMIFEMIARSKQ